MNEWMRRLLFLPEQASTFAARTDRLHFFIVGVGFTTAFCIGVVSLVFLVRYRRRQERAETPRLQAPSWLEGLFIVVPLSFFLLWFVIGFRDYIWVTRAPRGALDVYVTGKQWMWKFAYPDGPSSVGVLHVPAGRPVRLLLTSRDVIHSFFVPDFRIKRDAIPSRYTEIWFEAKSPGRHLAMCAEYCGLNHSGMRAEVVVLAPAEFEAWKERERRREQNAPDGTPREAASTSMASRGERIAARVGCLRCHSVDGTPHIGPTWAGLYGRRESLQSGETIQVDEAYLTESIMQPLEKVVARFNPVMPSYFGQLDSAEVAALIEYIKSLPPSPPGPTRSEEPTYVPARP